MIRRAWNVTKSDLEQACLAEAGRRFMQVNTTPLLIPPLLNLFGESGINSAATQVLKGSFMAPPTCDPYAAAFLSLLARPLFIKDVPARDMPAYCKG